MSKRECTARKSDVRYVKFTPEEMAYDLPDNVDPKRWTTIARGRAEWEQFLSFKRGYVRLDPDLREFFKDDGTVNQALRQAMVLMKLSRARGDKKTA